MLRSKRLSSSVLRKQVDLSVERGTPPTVTSRAYEKCVPVCPNLYLDASGCPQLGLRGVPEEQLRRLLRSGDIRPFTRHTYYTDNAGELLEDAVKKSDSDSTRKSVHALPATSQAAPTNDSLDNGFPLYIVCFIPLPSRTPNAVRRWAYSLAGSWCSASRVRG